MECNELTHILRSSSGKDMLKMLGSRGTIEVLCVFCCSKQRVRFTELSKLFNHISTRTLASRLKQLERGEDSDEDCL